VPGKRDTGLVAGLVCETASRSSDVTATSRSLSSALRYSAPFVATRIEPTLPMFGLSRSAFPCGLPSTSGSDQRSMLPLRSLLNNRRRPSGDHPITTSWAGPTAIGISRLPSTAIA
jgi:hypothetical protein